VIARVWTARTSPAEAPLYAVHLKTHVLPELRQLDGYFGAVLLQRTVADEIEIVVVTSWRSIDAIRSFAGAGLEEAVVADEAAALLTQFDRRVRHYDLVLSDGTPFPAARG
jgi:heme-degrading monooxygenase HmoA